MSELVDLLTREQVRPSYLAAAIFGGLLGAVLAAAVLVALLV
jgi:hypothetical protein